jgi:hypothetical protein
MKKERLALLKNHVYREFRDYRVTLKNGKLEK